MIKSRLVFTVLLTLGSLALTGCPERKRISDITADPGRYYDKEVTVAGRVTRSYGAGPVGVFEIDDGTGRLWVYSEKHGVPSKDAYVGVSGRIMPGVTYAGRNYGTGMIESKRHKADR